MRKLQGVKWKNSIGNGRQAEKAFDRSMYAVSDMILTAVCTIVFIVSACVILSDVFEWAKFEGINVLYMTVIAVLVSIAMEAAKFAGRRDYIIKAGILVAGMAGFGLFLLLSDASKDIFSGWSKIAALYAKEWVTFYKTNAQVSINESVDVTAAYNFVTLFIFFIMMWLAKMTKKNIISVIIPVVSLLMEFLIARWPDSLGMILMFAGVLLANTMGWKTPDFSTAPGYRKHSLKRERVFGWIVVGASIFCLWGLVNNIGEPPAKYVLRYADDVKAARKEIINKLSDITSSESIGEFIENIVDAFFGNSENKTAELSNDTPVYKNEVVLVVKMEEKPLGTVYLKGFDADTYDDGEWSKDEEAFEKACRDAGYEPELMSKNITNLAVSKILKYYNVSSLIKCASSTRGNIIYTDSSGMKAYCPYFMERNSNEIEEMGDGSLIKEKGTEEVSFYLWKPGPNYDSYYHMFDMVTKERWEIWYERYVNEHYLGVPDNLKSVEEIANEIETQNFFHSDNNSVRIEKARLVSLWMKNHTEYSLELPDVPGGEDGIEFFLGTSRTGYCMHYASASVMILRKLGVPARYVSGYIAPSNLFKYESDSNRYIARVKDNKAHAWVEIYLEGMGWVPVEVTKGYSSQGSVAPEDTLPEENQPEEETTKTVIQEQPTSPKQNPQDETKDKEENIMEQPSGNVTEGTEQTTSEIIENESGKTSDIFGVLRVLAVCIVIVFIPTVIAFIILKKKSKDYNHLQKLIKQKRTLRAIKFMNRQIYKKLCLSGKTLKTSMNDAAYGEALKKTYPEISAEEWDKYMDIVKAAAFSRREFSVEEMEFCNAIGTVILYRGASPCITFGVKRNK